MNHAILFDPSFSMLEIELATGDQVTAEAGSLVCRSANVTMTTSLNAGKGVGFLGKLKSIFIALIKKMLGGETFFVNTFASSDGQKAAITLAPPLSGAIVHRKMINESLTLQGGAFLASSGDFEIKVKFAGLKALFSGHGLFFLKVSGSGDLFFSAYGGVLEKTVNGQFTLDTGHLVAFDPTLDYKIGKAAASLTSSFFSGEGLVMNFTGQGKLYLQSRNVGALVGFVNPRLPAS